MSNDRKTDSYGVQHQNTHGPANSPATVGTPITIFNSDGTTRQGYAGYDTKK